MEIKLTTVYFIYFVIFLAFVFEFLNGVHDAANSVATIVATGVLKPWVAVIWAAFFNFIAFLFFHLNVANTLGTGLVQPDSINATVIFSALIAAILFNLTTWYLGLPSSSSHALIGGLLGAAIAHKGIHVLEFSGVSKVLIAIVLSPLLGMFMAVCLLWCVHFIFGKKSSQKKNWVAKIMQLISAAMLSLAHGANDAQKTMGVIAILLFSSGLIGSHFHVPFWVVISCNLVMALGTLVGGFRIIKTLGKKITKLTVITGAVAQTSAAVVIFIATSLGIPVSTTHTITGSIMGMGFFQGWKKENIRTIKKIVWAWICTIPCTALLAAIMMHFF